MLFVTPAMPIGLRGLERNLLNPHYMQAYNAP